MTLEDLRVFAIVAAERSFSRAARKLRRTQPAVSQAIRRLEDDAGERLIDRSSRDGTLTDAGERAARLRQRGCCGSSTRRRAPSPTCATSARGAC